MRILRSIIIIILISTLFILPVFALSDIQIDNGFIQVTINKDNGRYTIQTIEGSSFYDDSNQPILFRDRRPDTSFTTFKIDGEDYIYGNDYTFKGMNSGFTKIATIEDGAIVSTWVIDGIAITQSLILDDTDVNAGNVKISYFVENDTSREIEIGSRILLDTMLGANDGSPIILGDPLLAYHRETEFENPPVYWKAEDNYIGTKIVSFGILSGWRNTGDVLENYENAAPDQMIVAHWEGLSQSKWDYDVDETLNFTSSKNVYGSSDSAVAMYWMPQTLESGHSRSYEMYYGMGMFSTLEYDVYADMKITAPEKIRLNEQADAYTDSQYVVNGLVENNFDDSVLLENASVEIIYKPGSIYLPSSLSRTLELGDIEAGDLKTFAYTLEIPELYSWTLFEYEVVLKADNLTRPVRRFGNVLVPPLSGTPPDLQFTSFGEDILYYLDEEKELMVEGTFLTSAQNYKLVVSNAVESFIIDDTHMDIKKDSILIKVPKDMLKVLGLYDVKMEYTFAGEVKNYPLSKALVISDDPKYMIRKYQKIGVIREKVNETYIYRIVSAETADDFKQYLGDDLMISIEADVIKKSNDVYRIDKGYVTINSIVTCNIDAIFGYPITIEETMAFGEKTGVQILGSGVMNIPKVYFFAGPFEIGLEDGVNYTVNPHNKEEKDYQPVEIIRPSIINGVPVADEYQMLQGLAVTLNHAKLTQEGVIFGGSINILDIIAGPSRFNKFFSKKEKKSDKKPGDTPGDTPGDNSDDKSKETSSKNKSKPPDVDAAFDIGLDRLGYVIKDGKVVFDGLTAHGKFGIPKELTKKFFSDMDLGVGADILIDSYKNWLVKLEGQIAIKMIEADMVLAFKLFNDQGVFLPFPDELGAYGAFEPGVPFVPGVFNVKGFGLYVSGLYDTFANYSGGTIPIKGTAKVTMSLFEILNLKKTYLTLGVHEIEVGVEEVLISSLKILEKLKINLKYENKDEVEKVALEASGDLNIEDILVGGLSFVAELDEGRDGPLGPISLSGKINGALQVPKDFFLFPGYRFASILGEVNEHFLYGQARLIGIPFSARYRWGGTFDFRAFGADGMVPINDPYSRGIYSDDGQRTGTLYLGENLRLISDSRRAVCALDDSGQSMLLASSNATKHYVDVLNYDNILVELEYLSTLPEVSVKDPSGSVYVLTDNNMILHEVDLDEDGLIDKKYVILSVQSPVDGQWTIEASTPVFMKAVEASNLPMLTGVTIEESDAIEVTWSGDSLESKSLVGLLVKSPEDIGVIVFKDQQTTSGRTTIEIPELTMTGDYYVKLQLIDPDGTPIDSMISTNSFHVFNPNQPGDVNDIVVSNAGNAYVDISWSEVTGADDYMIIVRDSAGDTVYEFETYEIDNRIGGILEVSEDNVDSGNTNPEDIENYFENDMEADPLFETQKIGMFPNETYEISVMSRKTVGNNQYYSSPKIVSIKVNEPNPCQINYSVSANYLGKEHELDTYIDNQEFTSLSIETDQLATIQVMVNDELVHESDGQSKQIDMFITEGDNSVDILATNAAGDRTYRSFNIILDTVAPILRIDTPGKNERVSSTFTVDGHVEFNTEVFVNHELVKYDQNGYFSKEIIMDNVFSMSVSVIARDEAGNESEYYVTVQNDSIGDIKALEIEPNLDTLELGERIDFDAYLVNETGEKFLVDDQLIKWFKLSDKKVLLLDEEGVVTGNETGSEGLVASFSVSADYAFEDAQLLDVVDQIKVTSSIESIAEMQVGINQKKRLTIYENFTDGSKKLFDNNVLTFSTDGNNFTISSAGEIIGKSVGSSIVTCNYYRNGITYTSQTIVTITSNAVYDPGDDDDYIIGIIDEPTPLGDIEFYQPYISGYPDGSFRPMTILTRGELAVIFCKILALETPDTQILDYTDIKDHWALNYIEASTSIGLFSGYEDKTFRADAPITHGELAQVFSNYWSYAEKIVDQTETYDQIHWAKIPIEQLISSGIATKDDMEYPDANVLRREAVHFINMLITRPLLDGEPLFSDIENDPYLQDINAASQVQVKTNDPE